MEYDYDNNESKEKTDNSKLCDLVLLMESQVPSFFQKNQNGGIKIVNFGQIASLSLPKDWQPHPPREPVIGEPVNVKCTLPNGGDFALREKGFRISEQTGNLFSKTLKQPLDPKTNERIIDLKTEKGKQEYEALKPVLSEEMANTNKFNAELVRVETIGGRQILEVMGNRGYRDDDGVWTSSDKMLSSIYIDKFGKGDAIQEIRLEADKKNFQSLQKELDQTLKSIKWKDIPASTVK